MSGEGPAGALWALAGVLPTGVSLVRRGLARRAWRGLPGRPLRGVGGDDAGWTLEATDGSIARLPAEALRMVRWTVYEDHRRGMAQTDACWVLQWSGGCAYEPEPPPGVPRAMEALEGALRRAGRTPRYRNVSLPGMADGVVALATCGALWAIGQARGA